MREKTGDAVRTNFAAHMYSYPFAKLARHPRMVEPVKQLFGEDVYMHQFKINGKAAFDGDVWQWHQDYGTWRTDDLMPEARAMNVAIFLDDVNEFNGPLMFIPGSHKLGVLDAEHDTTTTSYPLWTVINHDTIAQAGRARRRQAGIVAPKGPAGSMILFHGCLVHASTSNLSPWNRVSVYLSLCAVSNHIRRFKRPGYIAHRDFTPIQCLPDDCLLKHYDVPLPWKDGTPPTTQLELKAAADESLRQAPATRRRGQAAAHRPDRRGQVRRDVPRAGAETPGVHLVGIADLSPDARANLRARRLDDRALRRGSLDEALKEKRHPRRRRLAGAGRASRRSTSSSRRPATRPPRSSMPAAFANGKHVVMVTVEADAFCGPLLARKAAEAGVVYSLAYGDQPALICDLVDWARACGFPVVAAGRGHKWLPHFAQSTPETVWGYYGLTPEQAKRGGLNPKMFNSFLDGSKPAIETTAVCNATGLTPAPGGLLYPAGEHRRHPLADAAAKRGRRAASQGQVEVDLLARDRRQPSLRHPLGRVGGVRRRDRVHQALLRGVRREDRSIGPLRVHVQALAPDRPGGRHLGRLRRPARRADRLRDRVARRRRRHRQEGPEGRRSARRRRRLHGRGAADAGCGFLAPGRLPLGLAHGWKVLRPGGGGGGCVWRRGIDHRSAQQRLRQ